MWYYMIKDSPNELYHHGIKGMKWGVRRYRNKNGSLTSTGKKRYRTHKTISNDAKIARDLKRKRLSELSNDEIRTVNQRTQLEREYKRLNPNHIAKGIAFLGTTAGAMGTVLALYNNSQNLIKIGKKYLRK